MHPVFVTLPPYAPVLVVDEHVVVPAEQDAVGDVGLTVVLDIVVDMVRLGL
jgi:hypothetical protein